MADMLNKLLKEDERKLKQIDKEIQKVEVLASKYRKMSEEELRDQTLVLKKRLQKGETLDDILPDAFAAIREASYRVNGEFPYHVQLIGGYVLHHGDISQQATGEGKTLTSVLPAYLNALEGKGVHIITVNEYLAERDAIKNAKIFNYMGLSVGLNRTNASSISKREVYNCDITYTTNSELGFDYLRDNMVTKKEERVMRPLNYAIIDEIDSILIDDATTPLIISGKKLDTLDLYKKSDEIAKTLIEDVDFKLDLRERDCLLTDDGIKKIEDAYNLDNLYSASNASYTHFIKNAIEANFIMKKDVDYIVDEKNQEILIVDPNTGRTMEGRQWSNGLHQAVEAKENIDIKSESKTVASITYQNLFRMYKKLSGISGTAKTEEEEFLSTYNMYVVTVPTNKPIARIDYDDKVYKTLDNKYQAIIKEIKRLHDKGQPVLVGTVAIETSELLSKMLKECGITHQVLNAKNDYLEAEIISHAGEVDAVTIATNMAGRGTDIKLDNGAKELGGLAVIGTERHKSKRIDDQLRGRSGRQGDPGSSIFFVSLEDDLMVQYGSERIMDNLEKLNDGQIILNNIINAFDDAQKRVEGLNFDARKSLLDYDDILTIQRNTIYAIRDKALLNDNVHDLVIDIFKNHISYVVNHNMNSKLLNEEEIINIINDLNKLKINLSINPAFLLKKSKEEVIDSISEYLITLYELKIKDIEELIYPIERSVILKFIDLEWADHIAMMDELRKGISLRSYAQDKPLEAYSREAYHLFDKMMATFNEEITKFFMMLNIEVE